MPLGGNDLDSLEANALQLGGNFFRSFADVVFAIGVGRDAGNAQQVLEFGQKALLIIAGVGNCRRNGRGRHEGALLTAYQMPGRQTLKYIPAIAGLAVSSRCEVAEECARQCKSAMNFCRITELRWGCSFPPAAI